VGGLDDDEASGRVEVHKWIIAVAGGEIHRLAMAMRKEKDRKVLTRDGAEILSSRSTARPDAGKTSGEIEMTGVGAADGM